MALRLTRISNLAPEATVRCSVCKSARTTRRVAGSIRYGGQSCCQPCYEATVVLHEYKMDRLDSAPLSEADYQSWAR